MQSGLKKIAIVVASALLVILAIKTWAAPAKGVARLYARETTSAAGDKRKGASAGETKALAADTALLSKANAALPFPVRFRNVEGRGLLINAWINEAGPFTLAIDTGAGATIISERVAGAAGVQSLAGRRTTIGGLSGSASGTGREAKLRSLAIGDKGNRLPSQSNVIVTNSLPQGVDGVLDPTEAFWPLGYVIDLPQGTIGAFDPRTSPLKVEDTPRGGAVVQWIFDGGTRRPFVRLENGRRALIDTGSGFGLALSEAEAESMGVVPRGRKNSSEVRDLGGGSVSAHRITSLTVRIGPMALRNVPTDLLYGASAAAPIILGRDALYPFKLAFDPLNRLVSITPR
jgi:predicted aspartyl protease